MKFLSFDRLNGGFCQALWPHVLLMSFPAFQGLRLDQMIMKLIERAVSNWETKCADAMFRCVEICAGAGQLSKSLIRAGFRTASFDIEYDDLHDLLKSDGFRLYVNAIASLAKQSLIWFGVPCSSWVTLCRSNSKRNESNYFWGDQSRPFVCDGNSQMICTSILFLLGALLGHACCLEQPLNSCLPDAKPLKTVFDFLKIQRLVTYAGAFGSSTCKPLQILTTHRKFFSALERDKPDIRADESQSLVIKSGSGFTGIKHALADSAVYTAQFGNAVTECFQTLLNQ